MNHCELTLPVLINSCHRNKLALFQPSAVSNLPPLLFSFSKAKKEKNSSKEPLMPMNGNTLNSDTPGL